jgi:hypothetical protein
VGERESGRERESFVFTQNAQVLTEKDEEEEEEKEKTK